MTKRRWYLRLVVQCVFAMVALRVGATSAQECRLEDAVLTPLLQRAFAALVSPQSNTTVGSYGALDIKDAAVTFAGTTIFKRGVVLGVKLHGGITEGLLPVFTNKALNPKFGGDVQLSLLDPWAKGPELYDYDLCQRYQSRHRQLVGDSALRAVDERTLFAAKQIMVEIEKLDTLAATLSRRANDPATTPSRRDSIGVALQRVAAVRRHQVQLHAAELAVLPTTRARRLRNWFIAEEDKLADSVSLKGFAVGWLSIGYGAENMTFRLFDPALPYANQVTKRAFLSHTVRAQYSWYNYSPARNESYYWSVGAALGLSDNFGTLSKTELTETTPFGLTAVDRVGTKKYDAFQGDYRNGLLSLSLFGDYYRFMLADNQVALHLYPEVVLRESEQPSHNLGVGFLFVFRKEDKVTTFLNAEAYMKLEDLANNNHPGLGPLKRSSYGFRFSVPVNFPQPR